MPVDRIERRAVAAVAIVVVSLLASITAARPARAQALDPVWVYGSVSITQPLARHTPGDLTARVIADPSPRAFAPWVAAGLWSDGLLARGALPIGDVGLRYRRRSLRVAFGLSRDVVYGRLDQSGGSRSTLSPEAQDSARRGLLRPTENGPVPIVDSGRAGPQHAGYTTHPVSNLVASAEWSPGRVNLSLAIGWRLIGPGDRQPWLSAKVAAPIVPAIALTAGVEHRRSRVLAAAAPTHLRLGFEMRSALWRRATTTRPVANDSSARTSPSPGAAIAVYRLPNGVRLRVLAPGARAIDLRSDLTQWEAIALQRATDGAWQVDLDATPGIHRLAIRVDGGPWFPPPGLPVGSDGYGLAVGVLVVDPSAQSAGISSPVGSD